MSSISLHSDPSSSSSLAEAFRVSRVRALRGPNYWRLAPVIACDVRPGPLERTLTSSLDGFADRLVAGIPTLHEHPCSRGGPGGFVERLREGTRLPHVLEHVALELRALAGTDVSFGRVVPSGDEGVWWVIVEYQEEDVGTESVREAARLIRACIRGEPVNGEQAGAELQRLYESVRLGPSTGAIVEEARRRGIPVRRLNSHSLVQLGQGRHLRRIQATVTDRTSSIAVDIAQDKDETKRVLGNIGLPVPRGDAVRSVEDAIDVAEETGYPVILKPLDASHGRGISSRLDDGDALRQAWKEAHGYGRRVVIEQFATGRDHRVLVVNGRMVACAERVPARVVGDGRSTIRALIQAANPDPRRGVGHAKILTHLPLDTQTEAHLAMEGRTPDTVPAAGEEVFLRQTANLSTGGTAIDRTDEMHPDNVTACEMAADAVGLDIAGIDVMTEDISVPFRENGAVIIEVNAGPGIRMHTHPTEGKPRPAGAAIVDMLFPPGADSTIPVIAVTGTNGKTTTTRLIAHLFRNMGKTVGFTTTDGVYLQNRLVMEGDMTGPFAANIILTNPTVDVAVLETARGGILRAGLGFEACDVGVVLNVSVDHLGLRGINTVEQLAEVKSVIPATVNGGLLSFHPSPSTTPGRLNMIRVAGGRVLIDYAHNAAAIKGLTELVFRTPAAKRYCVLTVPGDRRDEDIRMAGRLCAGFDRVILKEDTDRRGREQGEIVRLLREGLLDGGQPASSIEVRYEESEAINRGLDLLGEEDLVVIHAARVPPALAIVRQRALQTMDA